jgi:hypothetical protein
MHRGRFVETVVACPQLEVAMEVIVTGVILLFALGVFVRGIRLKKVVIEFDRREKPPKQLNH